MRKHFPYCSAISRLGLLILNALCLAGFAHAETILVESRTAADTANAPAWVNVSGTWSKSKNKCKVKDTKFSATNVFICAVTNPAPAFKISPPGIKAGSTYSVEVGFGASKTQVGSSDLVVAVTATGVTNSTIPAETTAFQAANANTWRTLGNITATDKHPSLTFTYLSGTLSAEPPVRWYVDSVRFVTVDAKTAATTDTTDKTNMAENTTNITDAAKSDKPDTEKK